MHPIQSVNFKKCALWNRWTCSQRSNVSSLGKGRCPLQPTGTQQRSRGDMARTALLIRCNVNEADKIRAESRKAQRTIAGYVLHEVLKAVTLDDQIFSKLKYYRPLERSRRRSPSFSPRTAILVRCTVEEGGRVRQAAKRRSIPINAFVLRALKMIWSQDSALTLRDVVPTTEAPDGPSISVN
jgi:hypothetical protein